MSTPVINILKNRMIEIIAMVCVAIGILSMNIDQAEATHYYGDNHGGNVDIPPDGSVINIDLSEQYDVPIACNDEMCYMYLISHWFDPEQIAQMPSEVFMHGVAPYDHGGHGYTSVE